MKKEQTSEDNLALSVWIRLLKTHNLVFREARTRMAPYCTMAQFDVLAQLSREKDGATPAELSRRLLVTAGNLTGLLDRMEKSGFLSRQRDSNDRRLTRVSLTQKGKDLAKKIIPIHTADIQELASNLSVGELKQLRQVLDKWIQGLTQEPGVES